MKASETKSVSTSVSAQPSRPVGNSDPNGIVVAAAATAALSFSGPALAYLDPGTGSILLQGLLASIAAALGVIGLYWDKTKTFFASLFSAKDSAEQESEKDAETQ